MLSKNNWEETKQRFTQWWNRVPGERPMMRIVARRETPTEPLEPVLPAETPEQLYLDVDRAVRIQRNYAKSVHYIAEAFPNLNLNLGPGSMALYLGSEPVFYPDTLWYKECVDDWDSFGMLQYNPKNQWWQLRNDWYAVMAQQACISCSRKCRRGRRKI